MAVAGRSESADTASDAASSLREAAFVRVLARPTGDALAATGLLARALDAIECPFQARIAPTGTPEGVADDETTVLVGAGSPAADVAFPTGSTPASAAAFETARAIEGGSAPEPVLALAGAVAADRGPLAETAGSVLDAAREDGIAERRPGIAIPGTDLADGFAHSTLVHAPFSGDAETAAARLADIDADTDVPDAGADTPDPEASRRVASWLAVTVAGAEDATPRAATAVERALRPHPIADGAGAAGRFATVGGYADVLEAVAREAPGTGLSLVLGHDAREAALSAWREHARRAHAAVRAARIESERVDGAASEEFAIARVEASAPLATTARLLRDFRVAAPVVVAVTDGRAAAAGTDGRVPRELLASAATTLDGRASGDDRRVAVHFEGSADAFVAALEEQKTTAANDREDR